ncbi:hypothetical protein BGZ61DRAFT_229918 [Ilyonectria robusta]|uniref:uncharacterized protein n=1 Tax=Ilyonectria robusta TaxID=1079257 RepID=UPI001E8D6E3B|nr:uncharacterized protein BGZ61DRAFT_229918 [Ilyonectria robusta]KAH8651727.1 hypothetical protein BGZ61DRAFT_229918 [Ilyonectria robusta]
MFRENIEQPQLSRMRCRRAANHIDRWGCERFEKVRYLSHMMTPPMTYSDAYPGSCIGRSARAGVRILGIRRSTEAMRCSRCSREARPGGSGAFLYLTRRVSVSLLFKSGKAGSWDLSWSRQGHYQLMGLSGPVLVQLATTNVDDRRSTTAEPLHSDQ